jgi:SAM-dependent methyltransferase
VSTNDDGDMEPENPPADLVAFVRAVLPDPPARVLEIGAGAGLLAARLSSIGHDVVAIDPAPGSAHVLPTALHELDAPDDAFDAAVAVLSLHHVEPLRESLQNLARMLRPGARVAIDEFDVARFDVRAARWLVGQWAAAGRDAHEEPEAMVESHRAHLHPLSLISDELAAHFTLGLPVPGAYLHRWDLDPTLRTAEERLIADGLLPATGARLVANRR